MVIYFSSVVWPGARQLTFQTNKKYFAFVNHTYVTTWLIWWLVIDLSNRFIWSGLCHGPPPGCLALTIWPLQLCISNLSLHLTIHFRHLKWDRWTFPDCWAVSDALYLRQGKRLHSGPFWRQDSRPANSKRKKTMSTPLFNRHGTRQRSCIPASPHS